MVFGLLLTSLVLVVANKPLIDAAVILLYRTIDCCIRC